MERLKSEDIESSVSNPGSVEQDVRMLITTSKCVVFVCHRVLLGLLNMYHITFRCHLRAYV